MADQCGWSFGSMIAVMGGNSPPGHWVKIHPPRNKANAWDTLTFRHLGHPGNAYQPPPQAARQRPS